MIFEKLEKSNAKEVLKSSVVVLFIVLIYVSSTPEQRGSRLQFTMRLMNH